MLIYECMRDMSKIKRKHKTQPLSYYLLLISYLIETYGNADTDLRLSEG